MNTPPDTRPASRAPLYIALAVVVAVVAASLLVVFTRGGSAPLDPSTPEGVVQLYAQAVIDGDTDAAEQYLHPDLAEDCERFGEVYPGDLRVTLRSTAERGESATVTVVVAQSGGSGLFGPSEYQSNERFSLKRSGTDWRITDAPWTFDICERSW